MNLEVLLSCMHQEDMSIADRTHVQSDLLIINQCNKDTSAEVFDGKHRIRMISTTERGLSRSRNRALENACGDICLICDDDEILYDDYENKILQAFEKQADADVIAFQIDNIEKKYPSKKYRLNYITALRIASVQIAFKRKSILNNNIWFDETLGSGVSKAGGEENMFLYDCLKNKLNLFFVPVSIGSMQQGESQWFHGYTEEYFYDRGIFTRKLMGRFFASLYGIYYLIFKYSLYRDDLSVKKSFNSLFRGIYG